MSIVLAECRKEKAPAAKKRLALQESCQRKPKSSRDF
jgi:hypothetical protein